MLKDSETQKSSTIIPQNPLIELDPSIIKIKSNKEVEALLTNQSDQTFSKPQINLNKFCNIQNKISFLNRAPLFLESFKKFDKIGEGSFGKVFKAEYLEYDKNSLTKHIPKFVALKQILVNNEKEGFPLTALREIMLLKRLKHQNILILLDTVTSKPTEKNNYMGDVYLTFEYMQHDLGGILRSKTIFKLPEIKCIMHQILLGTKYLHDNSVLHRDLKPSNILLNKEGIVKIGDFGLSRKFFKNNSKAYTNRVQTRIYRAPELFFGEVFYSTEIDVWSIGCIFAQILLGTPLFYGNNDLEVIEDICKKLGDINESNYKGVEKLTNYHKLKPTFTYKGALRSILKEYDDTTYDFCKRLLEVDPKMRITINDALEHKFFKDEPLMCKPCDLQKFQKDSHDYEVIRDLKRKYEKNMIKNQVVGGEFKKKKKVKNDALGNKRERESSKDK